MTPKLIAEILEATMVLCFGISWPISILKSYRARTANGKSILFLLFIFVGYIAGIAWKMVLRYKMGETIKWPTYFYFLNLVMVGTDIVLYFRNKALDKKNQNK